MAGSDHTGAGGWPVQLLALALVTTHSLLWAQTPHTDNNSQTTAERDNNTGEKIRKSENILKIIGVFGGGFLYDARSMIVRTLDPVDDDGVF